MGQARGWPRSGSNHSPERIRTAVAGSKGQHAWPLHHGAASGGLWIGTKVERAHPRRRPVLLTLRTQQLTAFASMAVRVVHVFHERHRSKSESRSSDSTGALGRLTRCGAGTGLVRNARRTLRGPSAGGERHDPGHSGRVPSGGLSEAEKPANGEPVRRVAATGPTSASAGSKPIAKAPANTHALV